MSNFEDHNNSIEVNGVKYTINWKEYKLQQAFMRKKEQELLDHIGLGWLSAYHNEEQRLEDEKLLNNLGNDRKNLDI